MDFFFGLLKILISTLVSFQKATGFPRWVNDHALVWPVAETLHFIGLCLLIGAIGVFDLRLMGMAKAVPVRALQRLLPWGVAGFLICLATGVMFVTGNAFAPGEYLRNIAFLWKMSFLALAGLNLLVFHLAGVARDVEILGPGQDAPVRAKAIGAISLFLWVGVIVFGRMLPVLGDAF